MESYGLANGVAWHLFWIALGSAWLLWWVRRPLFLPRYKMLQLGQESALITPLDRKIAAFMLAGVPLFVFGAQAMTDRQYPRAIPLQAGMDQIEPLPTAVNGLVKVKVQRAEFNAPARSLTMVAQIHNASDQPIQIGELATANCTFPQPWRRPIPQGRPVDTVVAPQGLSLDSAAPIQPGETREVRVTATDSLWQRERLDGVIRDADSRLGGLLFFYGASGERYIASVSTAIIPTYN